MTKRFEIKYVRVRVELDLPVLGNNGDACLTDEEAEQAAKDYELPEEYVTDTMEIVKVIRGI